MPIPPAGITPAASFELNGFEPQLPPPLILADLIDPKTGDYASLVRGAGIADSLAQFVLTVQRDSGAAVRGVGHRFREITHVDGKAAETFESYAKEALKPGVDTGTLRLERAKSEVEALDGTQTSNVIEYIDLLAPPKDPSRRKTFNP